MPASLELPEEATTRALASLRRYAVEELDTEIGDLKARLLLAFILAEIGPSVYNLALADAQRWLQERVGDLDGSLGRAEFTHWPGSVSRKAW